MGYNPVLGTFIERDPIEADPNAYRYCENQPTNAVDPSGLAKLLMKGRRCGNFLWGISHPYAKKSNVWHIALVVYASDNGQNKQQYVLSWEGNGWSVIPFDKYLTDNKERSIWIAPIPSTDDQKMFDLVDKIVHRNDKKYGGAQPEDPEKYSLTNDCATNAYRVLVAGGARPREEIAPVDWGQNKNNPRTVAKWVKGALEVQFQQILRGTKADVASDNEFNNAVGLPEAE